MGVHQYTVWNGAAPTTAALVKVTTGTAIKTMLQLSTPATRMISIIQWGYSLDAVPGSTGGQIELLETDVGATAGTAHVAAGVQPLMPGVPASLLTLGTGNTGYSFGTEGSTTASRVFDAGLIPPTAGADDLNYDMPFSRPPVVNVSKFLRVRCTFAAAVGMSCYVIFEE